MQTFEKCPGPVKTLLLTSLKLKLFDCLFHNYCLNFLENSDLSQFETQLHQNQIPDELKTILE